MLLTVQQEDIMTILCAFKCLRYTHIQKYIFARHQATDEHLSKMLKQLSLLGKLRIDGEYVMLPGRKIDAEIIKAFDVVMELTGGCVEFISPGNQPFTLIFSVKTESGRQDYNYFGVAIVEPYCENRICGYLNTLDHNLTVIFVLNDKEQQWRIHTKNRSFLPFERITESTSFSRRPISRKIGEEYCYAKKKREY